MSGLNAPSAKECEKFLDHVDNHFKAADIARSPHASIDVLRKMAVTDWRGYTYLIRAAIADNPNVPEDLIVYLMSVATERHEWYGIHRYWMRRYQAVAPDYDSSEAGSFPFELVSGQPLDDDQRAKLVLEIMGRFSETMWHDLASKGLLELDYWQDHIDGDNFGPINWFTGVNEAMLYRILGRGYFTDWIAREGHVDVVYGLDHAADFAEEYLSEGEWAYSVDEEEPFPAGLLVHAAALGVNDGHLTIDHANEDLQDLIDNAFESDETMFDFEVTVTGDAPWEGTNWDGLAFEARRSFIDNLIALKDHPYLGGWGFAPHMLGLIAIHPATEASLIDRIRSVGLVNVNKAIDDAEAPAA